MIAIKSKYVLICSIILIFCGLMSSFLRAASATESSKNTSTHITYTVTNNGTAPVTTQLWNVCSSTSTGCPTTTTGPGQTNNGQMTLDNLDSIKPSALFYMGITENNKSTAKFGFLGSSCRPGVVLTSKLVHINVEIKAASYNDGDCNYSITTS